MELFPNTISEKVFEIDSTIRFVGIFQNNQFHYSYKKGITPLIDEEKTIESLKQAVNRWKERKESLSDKVGNPIYSITMYEMVKRIIFELSDGSLVMLSTELEADNEKLLLKLMNLKDSFT